MHTCQGAASLLPPLAPTTLPPIQQWVGRGKYSSIGWDNPRVIPWDSVGHSFVLIRGFPPVYPQQGKNAPRFTQVIVRGRCWAVRKWGELLLGGAVSCVKWAIIGVWSPQPILRVFWVFFQCFHSRLMGGGLLVAFPEFKVKVCAVFPCTEIRDWAEIQAICSSIGGYKGTGMLC